MKRAAFVSLYPIFPVTSGNRQRILNLVRAVRELGYEVTFFFLTQNAEHLGFTDEVLREHQRELGEERFVLVDCKRGSLARIVRRVARFWQTRKFKRLFNPAREHYANVDFEYFPYYAEAISARVRGQHFDAVIVEYIFATLAFEAFDPSTLKVVDTHDSFADRHLKFMHLPKPSAAYWISVAPEEEARALRRADVVIAIQQAEAEDFRRRLGDGTPEVVTVSHIVSIPERAADYDSADAVFVGAHTQPNLVSLNWFIDNVLPRVRARIPSFRLHLVGSICLLFGDQEGIVRHGIIDNLSDAYRFASISINPTLLGTGINIKLLEAMAAGSPTVATNFGVRGMAPRYRRGVISAADDDPEAFAAALLTLVEDRELREAEGQRAREAALEWNGEQMESLSRILRRETAGRQLTEAG